MERNRPFVYIEKDLDLWVQLMKNGGKNKCFAFKILVSIYIYIIFFIFLVFFSTNVISKLKRKEKVK